MSHVFISYTRHDTDFVGNLKFRLEAVGFEAWVDTDRLKPGEDWRREIDQAIEASFCLIVVMSPNAFESKYVTYEWAYALGIGIKIVPILLVETLIHPRLDAIQRLDFSNHSVRPWEELIAILQELQEEQGYKLPVPRQAPIQVKQALLALQSWNPAERSSAAKVLGDIGNTLAVPSLIRALKDKDVNVRHSSAIALGQLKDQTAAVELIEALKDEDLSVRTAAVQGLGELKYVEAVPIILNMIETKAISIYLTGADALSKIGGIQALNGLLLLLDKTSDWDVRYGAANALSKFGEAATEGLLKLSNHENHEVRQNVARALGAIGGTQIVALLIDYLSDYHSDVRQAAVETLGELRVTSAVALLKAMLTDKNSSVRATVLTALQKINNSEAIEALIEALNSQFDDVRRGAVYALGQIKNPQTVTVLINCLKSEYWDVQDTASSVLKAIGTPEAIFALERWEDDRSMG